MSDKTTSTTSDQDVTQIDKALAAAKARKEAKAGIKTSTEDSTKTGGKAPKATKPKPTDEEKAAALAAREAERAEKKATRDAARAAKLAERNANKQAPHLAKVQRAAAKLGMLNAHATDLFNDATANLSAADIAILASHLGHFNRTQSTERALTAKLEVGQTVTITGGDPRFIGKTGTIAKAQRIRCYVTVEGVAKDVYCFSSDVTPVADETANTGS